LIGPGLFTEITSLVVAFGALVGWLVKLKWSREFKESMNERLKAAQDTVEVAKGKMDVEISAANMKLETAEKEIDFLKYQTPDNIKKQFIGMRHYYNEQIDFLGERIEKAHSLVIRKKCTNS
jgi:hypothetical protein